MRLQMLAALIVCFVNTMAVANRIQTDSKVAAATAGLVRTLIFVHPQGASMQLLSINLRAQLYTYLAHIGSYISGQGAVSKY